MILYKLILKRPEEGRPNELPTYNLIRRLFAQSLKKISLLKHEKNNIIQAQKDGGSFLDGTFTPVVRLKNCKDKYVMRFNQQKEINF